MLGKSEREREAALAKMPAEQQAFFKTPLYEQLPPALVEHWPFVILAMYAADVLILLSIGKVPLAYNLRNLRVRWKTNLMTAVAFTFVIGLMVFLLAFVNGMNNLTENSGVPGNVFVLSDGATDELFSNLGYGDLDNVERVSTNLDEKDRRLPAPIRVRQTERDGRPVFWASRETYYVINQPVPNTDPPRRRFVQLRTVEDVAVAADVHTMELLPGGKWFGASGVDDQSRIQCVLGEGVAGTLGPDAGKKRLDVGDTFHMGDMEWVVTGVMKTEGTSFGSEIWAKRFSRVYRPFGKENYTTLVMRTEQDTREAARALAWHLSTRYTQQKLKAFAEPDYYAELTKTNNTFLVATVIVAVVMAIGGVFGMMTTMFASIAQRIRDIGVLRLLGFKRWQVTVSFLLESLAVAVVGGVLGCLLAYLLADGRASTSTLSAGGGGPGGKSIALRISVDAQVMAMGMLFTLAMGRLGGLVPALSAMRIKILDSLR
jgi:ABC-type lipoprotein release transport system permease subunit